MALLRANGKLTPHELERQSLLRKHFSAYNRKLENMIHAGASAEYVLNAADQYKMTAEDLSDKVMAHVKHLISSSEKEAPSSEVKESKKTSKKAQKADAEEVPDSSTAE